MTADRISTRCTGFRRPSSSARKKFKESRSSFKQMQGESRRKAEEDKIAIEEEQTRKEESEKVLSEEELAKIPNPEIPLEIPGQVVFNELEASERKRKWKAFDYLCWAVRREGTGSLIGRAQWRKTKRPEVLDFQVKNIDKFLSDEYVLVFVIKGVRSDESFFMEPRSKQSDQRRLHDCYWNIECFKSMKVENREM